MHACACCSMHTQTHTLIRNTDQEWCRSLKMLTYAKKRQTYFDPDCKKAFSGDAENSWGSPGRFQHMKTKCQGKPFRFLGSFVSFSSYIPTDMPYIFLVTNSQFTLALCHLLQTNSYHSPWEKVVITASTLTFCVHVIVTSSLALKCWIIPAVFLHSKVLEKALLRMMVVMMMI